MNPRKNHGLGEAQTKVLTGSKFIRKIYICLFIGVRLYNNVCCVISTNTCPVVIPKLLLYIFLEVLRSLQVCHWLREGRNFWLRNRERRQGSDTDHVGWIFDDFSRQCIVVIIQKSIEILEWTKIYICLHFTLIFKHMLFHIAPSVKIDFKPDNRSISFRASQHLIA